MDELSEETVIAAVSPWVAEIRYLESALSTNTVAAEWAANGARHGSLVIAKHQTAGRGRLDRTWHSDPADGLAFTMVLDPEQLGIEPGLINAAVAVAVCRALRGAVLDVRIKWPNDLVIADRKIAGILSELVTNNSGDPIAVVGVGINVNDATFPEEIEGATSLFIETGARFDRTKVLADVLQTMKMPQSKASLTERFTHMCSTIGREVSVTSADGSTRIGVAAGIDQRGGLLLADGEIFYAGDVVHLRTT
ncbi:MAG: biotin--[acetyl-CoA-carboxylase] ligase [Actinomycetota bacterium]